MSDIILSRPDTSECDISVIQLSTYLQLKVQSVDDLVLAKAGLDAVAVQGPVIRQKFQKALDDAKAAYDSIAQLRDSFLEPLSNIDKYLRSEVKRFAEEEQERARKQLQEAAEQQNEEQDPWSTPVEVKALAPPVKIKGLSIRKLPARAIVDDKSKLVLAAAEALAKGDESFIDDLTPNEVALSEKARRWGKEVFEKKRPGCKFMQGTTVSRK